MTLERRKFGAVLAGMTALLWRLPAALAAPQESGQAPHVNPPERGLAPEGAPDHSAEILKSSLEERQNQIKKNVQRLYDLATELKNAVEKTDSSKVLSLNLVKKAEEAEKLAKQIKTLAQG